MKRYFYTYFDDSYLIYGLALFESLRKQCEDNFTLLVLALDDVAYEKLLHVDARLVPLRLKDLERDDPEFAACRSNRSLTEYYFTLSPVLPDWLFRRFPEIELLVYLDSDLFFFSSPEPLFRELGARSMLIFRHDHREEPEKNAELFGIYNVGCILLRRNVTTTQCLADWRSECLNWCFDRSEDGKYADQKYLDAWPIRYGVEAVVAEHCRALGLAPWSYKKYVLSENAQGDVLADGRPLIFFHFQSYKLLTRTIADFRNWDAPHLTALEARILARRYYNELKTVLRKYRPFFKGRKNFGGMRAISDFRLVRLEKVIQFLPVNWRKWIRLYGQCLQGNLLWHGRKLRYHKNKNCSTRQ